MRASVCVSAHCSVYRLFYQQNTEHKIWRCRSMLSSISFDLKILFTVVSVVRDVCTVCMCNSHLRTLPPLLLLLYVCEAKLIEFISPLHFHLILSAWFLCICVKFVYGCLFIWTLYIVVGVVVCNIKYIHHIFGIHPGIDVFASHDCSTAYLFYFMFTQFFFICFGSTWFRHHYCQCKKYRMRKLNYTHRK